MRLIRRRSRWLSKLRRHGIHPACLGIERHGACPALSLNIVHYAEFVGRVLMNHRQDPFAAGGKGKPGLVVEGGCVDSFTDRQARDNLSIVRIHYRHDLVVAPGKQTPVLAVDREATGWLTTRQGPAFLDLKLVGIESKELVLVFQVHENCAALGACGKFWLAPERDRSRHFALGSVHGSRILAPRVECEHSLRRRIVKDGIRTIADFDLAERLQGFEVENADRVLAPVAGESLTEFRRQRDSVYPGRVCNLTYGLA